MKYLQFLTILSFILFSNFSAAQCDGTRYIDNIFEEVIVTKDLKYGEGNEINGSFRELYMDIYEPANDTQENRPVVVLAFGGSFITGTRQDLDWLCEAYAKKGYVAVTIDYRLYDGSLLPLPTGIQMQEVVIKAVSDMKGAVRYLRQDADTDDLYRIDQNIILVGGISAGSIVGAHTAVLDSTDVLDQELAAIVESNNGIEGNTNDLPYSSEVHGFINFSGGLADASWIDESDPPFFSVHDEFDGVVPYGEGFASVFGQDIIYMEGSQILAEEADAKGIKNELITIESSLLHVGYFLSTASATTIVNQSASFMEEIVCSLTSTVDKQTLSFDVYPNPTSGLVNLSAPGISEITIFDSSGIKVLSEANNPPSIDMSGLSNGIYYLKAIDNAGSVDLKKVILVK